MPDRQGAVEGLEVGEDVVAGEVEKVPEHLAAAALPAGQPTWQAIINVCCPGLRLLPQPSPKGTAKQ